MFPSLLKQIYVHSSRVSVSCPSLPFARVMSLRTDPHLKLYIVLNNLLGN